MAAKVHKRVPAKEQFWRETVKAQTQSRQSIREFCREHELAESAFYFWRRELQKRDAIKSKHLNSRTSMTTKKIARQPVCDRHDMFVPLSLMETKGKGSAPTTGEATRETTFEMALPSGAVLRLLGGDAESAVEWIAELEARLC